MRLSSSEPEMTRPFTDPHPGQVLWDVVLPRRVTFWQSRHSKNFGSSLCPIRLPRDLRIPFLQPPPSRALFYTRGVATTSDRIKRADAGIDSIRPQRPGVTPATLTEVRLSTSTLTAKEYFRPVGMKVLRD